MEGMGVSVSGVSMIEWLRTVSVLLHPMPCFACTLGRDWRGRGGKKRRGGRKGEWNESGEDPQETRWAEEGGGDYHRD